MPERVVLDCDFSFANGDTFSLSVEPGRDQTAADDARFKFTLHPDEVTVEEHTVHRDKLNRSCITRRVLKDEA